MGPIPGGGTSMSELILSSYPPPPPWYKNFTTSESINREPPPLPDRTYTCFGCPRLAVQLEKKGVASLPQLDSDTRLYKNTANLKESFRQLFRQLSDSVLNLCGQLSTLGSDINCNVSSPVRTVVKLYQNLQHILTLLRHWEAQDRVVLQLERQVNSKRALLKTIASCLMPPVNGSTATR